MNRPPHIQVPRMPKPFIETVNIVKTVNPNYESELEYYNSQLEKKKSEEELYQKYVQEKVNSFTYSGEHAWKILQELTYTGENSFKNFLNSHKIFYRAHWDSYDNFDEVGFSWIIKRDYYRGYDNTCNSPYWELCINMPADPSNIYFPHYHPPRFIWKDSHGLKEIYITKNEN